MILTQMLVVLAVLVGGVTGAGVLRGRDGGVDVLRVVSAAGSSAQSAGTFRSTFSFAIDGAGTKITIGGEVLTDINRRLTSMTMDLPQLGQVEMIGVGNRLYTHIPGGRADSSGRHWFGYTSKAGESDVLGGQDPLDYLRVLGDPEDVRVVGEETVNGARTTHYDVDIDPQRMGDAIAKNPDAPVLPPGVLDQVKDATADLWLDDDNRPRRMQMALSVQSVTAKFSFDFFDYAKPVDVTAPPADDVTEVSSAQQLGQLLAGTQRR
jgi:hypothetical protein